MAKPTRESSKSKRPRARAAGKKKLPRKRNIPRLVSEEAARYGIRLAQPHIAEERYLSPNEAGRILGLTGEAVKQWIYRRRLPATKLRNGYWRIRAADLEAFFRARMALHRKRALLLFDEKAPREKLSAILEALGHEALVARNATDALLKAKDRPPAIFLADVSGSQDATWKLLRQIRRTSKVKNLAILLFSKRNLPEDKM